MPEPEPTFADLMRRLDNGDPAALNDLIRHYYSQVQMFACGYLRRYPQLRRICDSTDFAQDACLKIVGLLQKGPHFENEEHFLAVLRTITRRAVQKGAHFHLDAAKRDLRRQESLSSGVVAGLPNPTVDPAVVAEHQDFIDQFSHRLSETDSEIFRMRQMDLSAGEVAERLDLPERTIICRIGAIASEMLLLSEPREFAHIVPGVATLEHQG